MLSYLLSKNLPPQSDLFEADSRAREGARGGGGGAVTQPLSTVHINA